MKNNYRFFSTLLIVISSVTANMPGWKDVPTALKNKHTDLVSEVIAVSSITNCLEQLRQKQSRYVAFVMRPEEVTTGSTIALHRMMRNIDDDPFHDAIWGIVTGPTAQAAQRIAASSEPRFFNNILSTTGVGSDLVTGSVMAFSDANKNDTPEGDISGIFAKAWAKLDPELIVTSSHATQHNLEMPFSKGNLFPGKKQGAFRTSSGDKLKEPKREKVWIAAGNCLIADNTPDDNMVMTALGWGKVNQFVGYIKETWFGEIGWGTWHNFSTLKMPLNESWYVANQNLIRTIPETKPKSRDWMGKMWDLEGTILYGDPAQKLQLLGAAPTAAWQEGAKPLAIIFPTRVAGRKLVSAPEGFEVFVADDFALVTKWPTLTDNWQAQLKFSE